MSDVITLYVPWLIRSKPVDGNTFDALFFGDILKVGSECALNLNGNTACDVPTCVFGSLIY